MKEYALYKGEEVLNIGTAEEIAKALNIRPETVMFYGTNTYQKRLSKRKSARNARILIRLDAEE